MKQRKTLKGGMNSNSFPSPLSPIYGTTNLAKSTKKRRKSSLSIKRKKLSFNFNIFPFILIGYINLEELPDFSILLPLLFIIFLEILINDLRY